MNATPQKHGLPWWKSWWTMAFVLAASFCLSLKYSDRDPSKSMSLWEGLLIFAIWLLAGISFWFVWTSGERMTRAEKQRRADEKRDEYNRKWFEKDRIQRVNLAVQLFFDLTGVRLNPAAIYESMGISVYHLLGVGVAEKINPDRILDPTNRDNCPHVWLVALDHKALSIIDGTEYTCREIALGWKGFPFWQTRPNGSDFILEDLNGDRIFCLKETMTNDLLKFVTKYHSVKEALLGLVIEYGIPALEESKNGGKCLKLRNLRILLHEGVRIFRGGLNPNPDNL